MFKILFNMLKTVCVRCKIKLNIIYIFNQTLFNYRFGITYVYTVFFRYVIMKFPSFTFIYVKVNINDHVKLKPFHLFIIYF